jgi:hypothetical protein
MIIIGLLIGGVLKGQELIANAQVTSTVSQTKGVDAATTTFRDMYDALPGDVNNPSARLSNCTAAPCSNVGNGNRRIDGLPSAAPAGEQDAFWAQLAAADLITGIDPNQGQVWGGFYPEAEIGGGFHVGFHPGGALGLNNTARAGHYLALLQTPGGQPADDTLTPNQAFRIDNKLDDGVPLTGTVIINGNGNTDACEANGVYNESVDSTSCDLFIRFQN